MRKPSYQITPIGTEALSHCTKRCKNQLQGSKSRAGDIAQWVWHACSTKDLAVSPGLCFLSYLVRREQALWENVGTHRDLAPKQSSCRESYLKLWGSCAFCPVSEWQPPTTCSLDFSFLKKSLGKASRAIPDPFMCFTMGGDGVCRTVFLSPHTAACRTG